MGARRRRPASRWKCGRPSPASSSMPATMWRASRKGSAAAATRPAPASAWSRRSGRIRPTARISRRRCCGRARSTARRRSTGSGKSVNAVPQHLERRQRAAHLDDGRRDRVRLARRLGRRDAGKAGGEIGAVEGVAGAGRVDGRCDVDRRHVRRCRRRSGSAPAPRRSSRRSRRRRARPSARPRLRVGVAEQRLLVGKGRQRDVDDCQRLDDRCSRCLGIRPQPRPVVRIEGDQRSLASRAVPRAASSRCRAAGSRIAKVIPEK